MSSPWNRTPRGRGGSSRSEGSTGHATGLSSRGAGRRVANALALSCMSAAVGHLSGRRCARAAAFSGRHWGPWWVLPTLLGPGGSQEYTKLARVVLLVYCCFGVGARCHPCPWLLFGAASTEDSQRTERCDPRVVRSRQLRACRRTVEQVPRQPPSYQLSLRLQSFACTTCERAARKRHQGIVPTARRYGRIRTELPGPLIATCRATWTGGLASAVAELRGARHRSKGHSHSLHSPAIPGQLLPESCNICTCKREPTERTS